MKLGSKAAQAVRLDILDLRAHGLGFKEISEALRLPMGVIDHQWLAFRRQFHTRKSQKGNQSAHESKIVRKAVKLGLLWIPHPPGLARY